VIKPSTPQTPVKATFKAAASRSDTDGNSSSAAAGTKAKRVNVPFQRVKAEAIEFLPAHLRDNSYHGALNSNQTSTYGKAAADKMITVKGKGFRSAKTKVKRGSYRGGELDQNVRSIKFE
jgi:hypothetical protein